MLERSEFHLPSSNAITPLKQEKSRERVRSFAFQNKMFHLPSIKQSKAEALSGSSNPWQPSAPVWFCRMSQKRSSSQVDVELVFVFNLCMSLYMTGLSFLLSIYVLVGMLPSLQWFPPLEFLTSQLLAASLLWRYPRRISSSGQTCSKLHLLGLQQTYSRWRSHSWAGEQNKELGTVRRVRALERRWKDLNVWETLRVDAHSTLWCLKNLVSPNEDVTNGERAETN